MNAIEYIKEHHSKDSIITKDIVLAKFCALENSYKHSFIIPCNLLNIVNTLVAKYYNDTANAYYSSAQQIIENLLDIQPNSSEENTEVTDRNNFYYFPNYFSLH